MSRGKYQKPFEFPIFRVLVGCMILVIVEFLAIGIALTAAAVSRG